jgi:hypothetical protein
MNYLQAVFWDYPAFTNPEHIRQNLQESGNLTTRRWILQRFLEHARVVDTLDMFSLESIARELPFLRIQPYTRKKWSRILEVYGHNA